MNLKGRRSKPPFRVGNEYTCSYSWSYYTV